jgi:hypothetical protein
VLVRDSPSLLRGKKTHGEQMMLHWAGPALWSEGLREWFLEAVLSALLTILRTLTVLGHT